MAEVVAEKCAAAAVGVAGRAEMQVCGADGFVLRKGPASQCVIVQTACDEAGGSRRVPLQPPSRDEGPVSAINRVPTAGAAYVSRKRRQWRIIEPTVHRSPGKHGVTGSAERCRRLRRGEAAVARVRDREVAVGRRRPNVTWQRQNTRLIIGSRGARPRRIVRLWRRHRRGLPRACERDETTMVTALGGRHLRRSQHGTIRRVEGASS